MEAKKSATELVLRAKAFYEDALRLLDTGDVYDAAEKAWCAIENMRKACLVAVKVPYNMAKAIREGVPLFSKILEKIGKKDLLRMYFYFNSRLHTLGFYEQVVPEDDLDKIIREEVPEWMQKIEELISVLISVDLSEVVEVVRKINQVKQDIIRVSAKYTELVNKLDKIITNKIAVLSNRA